MISHPVQPNIDNWQVKKIGVIGPGIVGMPMAALLANAKIKIGSNNPAKVIVLQRNSRFSGWKVDAINSGKSTIGGIEPGLDKIVEENVKEGLLSATVNYSDLSDADVVLICVQTDKKGFGPDYGPLFEALNNIAEALVKRPEGKVPLIIFESTLAPSSMLTLIKDHFNKYGLVEGKDILLGNSPNRVMPGRLVHRVVNSDKLAGGLTPVTPNLIKKLYSKIVTNGTVHTTNSLTAEFVKTLENAYRDVRIAFSSEIVRYCDSNDIDFYSVREKVNQLSNQSDEANNNPTAVPSGGLLIPTVGVGGHCLPKDGILLWWRRIEHGEDTSKSYILNSRIINDESPSESIKLAEKSFGNISNKNIAILGAAYRFNSEDTRNSPSLVLSKLLLEKGCTVKIHDPFVKKDDQNLLKYNFQDIFTNDLSEALLNADYVFICTAHQTYIDEKSTIINSSVKGIIDSCNIYSHSDFKDGKKYAGIGRGKKVPSDEFIDFVYKSFTLVERGTANEIMELVEFLNSKYAYNEFNKIKFEDIQKLSASCSTGCEIANPGLIEEVPSYKGFSSRLIAQSFANNESLLQD